MWKPAKEYIADKSSLTDLKAEVARATEAKNAQKAVGANKKQTPLFKHSKVSISGSGNASESYVLHQELSKSKAALERKSKLYDQLATGAVNMDNEDDVLVDFEAKRPVKDETVEYVDEFGRTRVVSKLDSGAVRYNFTSDYKDYKPTETKGYHMFPPVEQLSRYELEEEKARRDEEAKQEWQDLLIQNKVKDEHYSATKDRRQMGVSHFEFSQDEAKRLEQQQQLKELRDETDQARRRVEQAKEIRKLRLAERMEKIRLKRKKFTAHAATNNDSTSIATEADAFLDSLDL